MNDLSLTLKSCMPIDVKAFPTTRYQGSKRKLCPQLYDVFANMDFSSALDLYCGTGTVSLLLKSMGKKVHANDILNYNTITASLLLNASSVWINDKNHESRLKELLLTRPNNPKDFVKNTYSGVYFKDDENEQIDNFCQNILTVSNDLRNLYIYCVGQALIMKRPYNLFHRANLSMRTKDVIRSFGNAKTWETPIFDHAVKILRELKRFPFAKFNEVGVSTNHDADQLELFRSHYDLIYLDPPYLNRRGQAVDYCDFYHFLEGLCEYSLFQEGDLSYPHKPIVRGRSAWLSKETAINHLSRVICNFPSSIFVLSYRLDGQPSAEEIRRVFEHCGRRLVEAISQSYKYALSKQDDVHEVILVSYPNS